MLMALGSRVCIAFACTDIDEVLRAREQSAEFQPDVPFAWHHLQCGFGSLADFFMKIVDAKVIISCPSRNFVTLKVVTEDRIYGLGDATLNGRELAVASYLSDHVVPLLIGRDARRIEDTWQYLYKGAYWRRGPVTMAAIAAVDTALWDIKAKSLNTPLYQLLAGASRDAVLVYAHASGAGIEETVEAVAQYLKAGYKATRAQSGIPGLESTYGVGRGHGHYEPAEKGAPPENA